jgi:hypothetical protein
VLAREAGGPLRIWIDGMPLADDWSAPPTTATSSEPLWLEAGAHTISISAVAGGDGRLHWALVPVFAGLPDWSETPDTGYGGPGPTVMSSNEVTSLWGDENLRNTSAFLSLTSVHDIVALFRARLTAAGWRDFPADSTGDDVYFDGTVAGLKRLFGFDLDSDADGDGKSFWQELAAGTDPYDYFNGRTPVVVTIGGTGQSGPPGHFLQQPWTVRLLSSDDVPLINAPMTFALPEGETGFLSAKGDGSTPLVKSLTVRTDRAGYAWVYLMP